VTSHDYRISPVPSAGWKECLTWIHAELPGAEMDALVEDALLKLLSADAQLPLEARLGEVWPRWGASKP
jgi:hypothetical protein